MNFLVINFGSVEKNNFIDSGFVTIYCLLNILSCIYLVYLLKKLPLFLICNIVKFNYYYDANDVFAVVLEAINDEKRVGVQVLCCQS